MVSKSIVEGMNDDHFVPDDNVTRAQFATLIVKALKLKDAVVQVPFADVPSGAWYESSVKKAYAAGLIQGVSESEFAPEHNITREEMTTMLMRANAYSKGVKVEDMTAGITNKFTVESAISDWAKKSVGYAISSGLMNGRTEDTFAPQEHATRAESAVVLRRLLSN
ncbi:S-layer homology domain-containing protein [Paenibacillus sp. N3.4]|uniref:S-layer homology domain-containing protein n=1 Tax=Paenibacillus sp. N3.4 TaxID=2603222 RepID=UPI001C9CD4FE|nr:S-layer homology domain-containing protein [Paenibacillus sp. N3.4]